MKGHFVALQYSIELLFKKNLICLFLLIFWIADLPIYGQQIIHEENFNICEQIKWTNVSTDQNQNLWNCDQEFSENIYRLSGNGQNIRTYLISNEIDLSNSSEPFLVFSYKNRIVNGDLGLFVSTDFNNNYTEDGINAANWTAIELDLYPIGKDENLSNSLRHPAIDLSPFDLSKAHFMFSLTSESGEVNWLLDDITIRVNYYSQVSNLINEGFRCENLKTVLSQLVDQHFVIPYTDLELDVWDSHFTTDLILNDDQDKLIIWDMYSHVPNGNEPYEFIAGEDRDFGEDVDTEGIYYNREHTFPRSWWGGEQEVDQLSDIHFVIPTDSRVNELRSNFPYGETESPMIVTQNGSKIGRSSIPGYDDDIFEPIDEYKGDLARMQLYVALRYDQEISDWDNKDFRGSQVLSGLNYPAYEEWYLNLLLKWHNQDPVSTKEIDRNNAVFSIQGNRNPFIDHPGWAGLIWGDADDNSCNDIISSIDSHDNVELVIYPNPVLDYLTIETHYDRIEIYNTNGANVELINNENQIDFSELSYGLYIVRLYDKHRELIGMQKVLKL